MNFDEEKRIKAIRKIEEIKKFYKHVVAYVLVNLFLMFIWKFSFKIVGSFTVSNQFDGDNFTYIPIWLIWGVFLIIHGIKTFDVFNLFGRDWEERKINEYMKPSQRD